MKTRNDYIVTSFYQLLFVCLLNLTIEIETCRRMTVINPLELETLDKDNVTLPRNFREILGKEIDGIIQNEFDKIEKIETKKMLKIVIEDLMGYGISDPCIVLRILDANLTSKYLCKIRNISGIKYQ